MAAVTGLMLPQQGLIQLETEELKANSVSSEMLAVNLMRGFSWWKLAAGDKFSDFEGMYCEGICKQH